MALESTERDTLAEDSPQESPGNAQPRGLNEPESETWWENPGGAGEVQ